MPDETKRFISLEALRKAAEEQARERDDGWWRAELLRRGVSPDEVERFFTTLYGEPGER